VQIESISNFRNCDHNNQCIRTAPLMIIVTIFPFVLLVLFDGMLCYHLFLSVSCLFAAFFGLNRPRLPEWSEVCMQFHHAPYHWWMRCTSPWGRKNSSVVHMPGIFGSRSNLIPTVTSRGADMSSLGR
jgi:hypothetical protein